MPIRAATALQFFAKFFRILGDFTLGFTEFSPNSEEKILSRSSDSRPDAPGLIHTLTPRAPSLVLPLWRCLGCCWCHWPPSSCRPCPRVYSGVWRPWHRSLPAASRPRPRSWGQPCLVIGIDAPCPQPRAHPVAPRPLPRSCPVTLCPRPCTCPCALRPPPCSCPDALRPRPRGHHDALRPQPCSPL